MIKHKHLSGAFIAVVGITTIAGTINYDIGTLARMGPGYYPLMLGGILVFLSLIIAFAPDSPDETEAEANRIGLVQTLRARGRAWAMVTIGMVAMVVLGKYGGLAPACFACAFLSALGDPGNSLKTCLALAFCVTLFVVAVFWWAMEMQFPLFTWG